MDPVRRHHPVAAGLANEHHGKLDPPEDVHWAVGDPDAWTTQPARLSVSYRTMTNLADYVADHLADQLSVPDDAWGIVLRTRLHARRLADGTVDALVDDSVVDMDNPPDTEFTTCGVLVIPFGHPEHTTLTLAPHEVPRPMNAVTVPAASGPPAFTGAIRRIAASAAPRG